MSGLIVGPINSPPTNFSNSPSSSSCSGCFGSSYNSGCSGCSGGFTCARHPGHFTRQIRRAAEAAFFGVDAAAFGAESSSPRALFDGDSIRTLSLSSANRVGLPTSLWNAALNVEGQAGRCGADKSGFGKSTSS
jgi:hypothetical protein